MARLRIIIWSSLVVAIVRLIQAEELQNYGQHILHFTQRSNTHVFELLDAELVQLDSSAFAKSRFSQTRLGREI